MPPAVALTREVDPWSQVMLVIEERSIKLLVPLTSKKARPEGIEGTLLRSILPPEEALNVMKKLFWPPVKEVTCERSMVLGVPVPLGPEVPVACRVGQPLPGPASVVTLGKAATPPPLAVTWRPLIDASPEKSGVPLLTVMVALVSEVINLVSRLAVPSTVRSV